MNLRSVTKSYCITFGAAEPNSISAKRNAESKKALGIGNVHPQEK